MRILTSNEVRQAEQEAISRPEISTQVLMQRAGYAVAQFCIANFKFNSVCAVCGKGNNGGDGMIAVAALREFADEVFVLILAKDASALGADSAAVFNRLDLEPIWIKSESDFKRAEVKKALDADLILDAIVGTGFKPPLRGLAKRAVDAINDASGTVVAVDLPSGVDADRNTPVQESGDDTVFVFSHGMVTFIAPKPAHVFGQLGTVPIAVSEIGVQRALATNQTGLQVITGQEVGIAFPPRAQDAHKGQFGHVLVIAGSLGKAGAAGMVGMAALRSGAGLVTVACPKSIQETVSGFAPEMMTEGLPETSDGSIAEGAAEKVEALLAGKDILVMGPGLSRNPETESLVRRLVTQSKLPVVLDADGLNAFAGHYGDLKPPTDQSCFRVLTPHPGEAARLAGMSTAEIEANRLGVARNMANATGSCVVLKGSRTIVAGASGETWINMSGNPALAKGGSGDVLSGIIGAALARRIAGRAHGDNHRPPETTTRNPAAFADRRVQEFWQRKMERNTAQMSTFLKDVSVAAAVHLHGMAADFARDLLQENTVLATDVLEALSDAFRECELQVERGLFYLQK
jgi:NAD(P)H-hydrate epimerase